jgi:integrase/recombinase XerD
VPSQTAASPEIVSSELVTVVSRQSHELQPHVEPTPLEHHPTAVYLASLSPGSRRCMTNALHLCAKTLTSRRCDAWSLPWAQIRFSHAAALRSALAETYAPASVNQALAAFKGVLKAAWRLGLLDDRDYNRAVDVSGVKNQVPPRGRAASIGEVRALLDVCRDGTPLGVRDAALLALAYGTGLRRAEIVALDLGDFNPETGELLVRRGKGAKSRTAYVAGGALHAVEAWLAVRGEAEGPLLHPYNRGGKMTTRRLSPQTVRDLLDKRVKQAGLQSLSPHDLRRTFISELLEAGADLSVVQQLAGHASVATTTRYDRRGEKAKRKAVALLHVPFSN